MKLIDTLRGGRGWLAVFLSLAAATSWADDCIAPSGTTNVTLRAAPNGSSATRGTLAPGAALPLVALVPNWFETRLPDGRMAFASKRSTDIVPCPAPPVPDAPAVAYEIHAIDVGTGLSVLVRGPDFTLLYDAGSNDDTARGDDNRTLAYLASLQPPVQSLDHVLLSHPHRDHVELLPDVIDKFAPSHVWDSGAYNDICGYRNFLFAISANPNIAYHTANHDSGTENLPIGKKTCYGEQQPAQTLAVPHAERINNQTVALGNGATMTFLYADGFKHSSLNENSLVVRLDLGTHRILFMGDAEAGGRQAPATAPSEMSIEGKLLSCCTPDLKADVLVVGHHGSKTSSRTRFLNAVGAGTYLVSAGPTKYATVTLPDAEVITELTQRGKVFRTDLDDDACKMSPDKIGPAEDGKPGGCDNIIVTLVPGQPVKTEYRRLSN